MKLSLGRSQILGPPRYLNRFLTSCSRARADDVIARPLWVRSRCSLELILFFCPGKSSLSASFGQEDASFPQEKGGPPFTVHGDGLLCSLRGSLLRTSRYDRYSGRKQLYPLDSCPSVPGVGSESGVCETEDAAFLFFSAAHSSP